MKLFATRVAVSLVAVASLSVAGAGVAGAASQPGKQPGSNTSAAAPHRLCTLRHQHQEQSARIQAGFAAGTARIATLEAKAQQAGDTKLATYWKSVVDHRTAGLTKRQARFAARWAHPGPYASKVGASC